MQVTRKIGHVAFEYDDEFKGDVTMRKGDVTLSVSMETLRAFVAEGVRHDLTGIVARMKPAELLRRIA